MIATEKKAGENGEYLKTNLIQVPYIRYAIIFYEKPVSALFDSKSEVNIICPIFAKELGLSI